VFVVTDEKEEELGIRVTPFLKCELWKEIRIIEVVVGVVIRSTMERLGRLINTFIKAFKVVFIRGQKSRSVPGVGHFRDVVIRSKRCLTNAAKLQFRVEMDAPVSDIHVRIHSRRAPPIGRCR